MTRLTVRAAPSSSPRRGWACYSLDTVTPVPASTDGPSRSVITKARLPYQADESSTLIRSGADVHMGGPQ